MSIPTRQRRPLAMLGLLALIVAPALLAQSSNECDMPGESPDVIVGDLHETRRWGKIGDITGFSVGTYSCNVGTCWLNWFDNTNQHPVIAQNMYRLKDGRFEHVGQSWLKHGFNALSFQICNIGCIPTDGTHLGVNCSDPYSSATNGQQFRMGAKFEVNPVTGDFPYPYTGQNQSGDPIYKRLQVHDDDLNPAMNFGAEYFVEGHYIAADDAAAGNDLNNASYRPIQVTGGAGTYNITLIGTTQREQPGIAAWGDSDPGVTESFVDVPGDGRFYVSSKATDLGGGMWHYEYAVQNYNSDRAAGSFAVPIPLGVSVSNVEFSDVDYHSGEPYDLTDWAPGVSSVEVRWDTVDFAVNPDANALRWATLYNFRFDADVAPQSGTVTLGMFKPGTPQQAVVGAVVPTVCNSNGVCDAGEHCAACSVDCPDSGPDDDSDLTNVCADCNDLDGDNQGPPGPVGTVEFVSSARLQWQAPAMPNGSGLRYEVLRSPDAGNFDGATCLTPSPGDLFVDDATAPAAGQRLFYLPRALNDCPSPQDRGSLGVDSAGTSRSGSGCP